VIDSEFKTVVGKCPTGVVVVATSFGNKLWGVTVNSFTSVSLKPQLISFCLAKQSRNFYIFRETSYFSVNILSSNQSNISKHFASHILNKFQSIKYQIGEYANSPLIKGAISCVECQKYKQFDCGDHYIFIGEVGRAMTDDTKSPLIYYAKSYKGIK